MIIRISRIGALRVDGRADLRGVHRARRQASEQYLTCSQFLAHRLRQVIGRPQRAQDLVGR